MIRPCRQHWWLVAFMAIAPVISAGEESAQDTVFETTGWPLQACEILLTWRETPPDGESVWVRGYRVKSAGAPGAIDLYTDGEGTPLDENALHALGITPKNWTGPAVFQDAEVWSGASGKSVAVSHYPVGASSGSGPSAFIELPGIDLAAVLSEDDRIAAEGLKATLRTGVFQELDPPIVLNGADASHGRWEMLDDGSRLWSAIVYSPEAVGQRIHFERLDLPPGGRVLVYDSFDAAYAYLVADGHMWSPTCFSDTVTIECHVPLGADFQETRLEVDRIVHLYRDFKEWGGVKAGYCNLDVSCYSEWADVAAAVGGIGTIGRSGSLWCTGTLLADTDPNSSIPYFWTADHCMEEEGLTRQDVAATIEVYWLYEADACNGVAPDARDVPRTTGGADVLAYAAYPGGTDFAFLRLRNEPPQGATFAGWSTAPHETGTPVTCIHHPSGSFKRISFGTATSASDPCWEDHPAGEHYYQALWSEGTTEGGSSGSPLLDPVSQRVVGQLFGGYASCFSPECPDYYGRFDVAFPIVEQWLAPANPWAAMDVDGSGKIDVIDLQLVVNAALGYNIGVYDADVDESGGVNAVDVQLVVNAVLSS